MESASHEMFGMPRVLVWKMVGVVGQTLGWLVGEMLVGEIS